MAFHRMALSGRGIGQPVPALLGIGKDFLLAFPPSPWRIQVALSRPRLSHYPPRSMIHGMAPGLAACTSYQKAKHTTHRASYLFRAGISASAGPWGLWQRIDQCIPTS